MNFGTDIGLDGNLCLFYISGSKVKGQGHKSGKICYFEPFLATGGRHGSDRDWVGSGGVLLAACQLFLALFQKPQNNTGCLMGWFPNVGRLPV